MKSACVAAIAAAIPSLLLSACGSAGSSSSDPAALGPFAVGVTQVVFERPSTTTAEARVLDTVVWYPAAPGSEAAETFFGGLRDVPVAEDEAFPLLVFSHGTCGVPTASSLLLAHLASHGFVVAAPPHPGNTADLGIGVCFRADVLLDSFINRADDVDFVIDEIIAASTNPASRFTAAVDPERVGVLGHSFGGMTAIVVAQRDPRIRAALPLAPGVRPAIFTLAESIGIPVMIQSGVLDSLVAFADLRALFDRLHPPRYFLSIENAGHFAFSDLCTTSAPRANPEDPFAECVPGTLSQEEAHAIVLRYAVPFLLRHVAGDHRFDALLDIEPTPAGVDLIADLGA